MAGCPAKNSRAGSEVRYDYFLLSDAERHTCRRGELEKKAPCQGGTGHSGC